jgi:hypothetical protein
MSQWLRQFSDHITKRSALGLQMAEQHKTYCKGGSASNVPTNNETIKRKINMIALHIDCTKQSLVMARFALFLLELCCFRLFQPQSKFVQIYVRGATDPF